MKCFVIMPYGKPDKEPALALELDLLYEEVIRPAVESVSLPSSPGDHVVCHRSDKESRPGEIIAHVIENLVLSEMVIADLTGRNPNVFYELGVRHAVNDNTILISQHEEDIPFDLRGQRLIIYRRDFAGGLRLRQQIVTAVHEIVNSPNRIDNPVRRFLYEKEKGRIEIQGAPPGYDVVKALLQEISTLRQDFKGQLEELRFVMNAATASNPSAATHVLSEDLDFLEGAWKASPSKSLVVVRRVNGVLMAPYLYGGGDQLGHYYNFNRVGENLFARFEWLTRGPKGVVRRSPTISGYGLYQIKTQDHLIGGWWYSRDVPQNMAKSIQGFRDHQPPGRSELEFRRTSLMETPEWAEEYFKAAPGLLKGNKYE